MYYDRTERLILETFSEQATFEQWNRRLDALRRGPGGGVRGHL